MIKDNFMKYKIISLILMVAMLFAACNPNTDNSAVNGTASLSVSISDALDSKLIQPDADNVDVSHYLITIDDGVSAEFSSGYLTKGATDYVFTGLREGSWNVTVAAYVNTAGTDQESAMVKVAEKTEKAEVNGSSSVTVTLDEILTEKAGTVTVSVAADRSAVGGGYGRSI